MKIIAIKCCTIETCMSSGVSFEVKSVVETFATDRAQITFHVVMATQMTRQQSLKRKHFTARPTLEMIIRCL